MPLPLRTVASVWTRIGVTGLGGPPAHIALLRRACVDDRRWIEPAEFEDAVAAVNLLPGPASTQLAIWTAWRTAGVRGALVGGLGFVVPGLAVVLALSALVLGHPPAVVLGAAGGAGAAVPAVAVGTAWTLVRPSRERATSARRWLAYALVGTVTGALLGAWVVVVLLACGLLEVLARTRPTGLASLVVWGPAVQAWGAAGGLAWTALKVGLLSYGGGFVIIPLMRGDAVTRHHWMTGQQFLDAVALGQVTPGPVTHTVAVVGYAAGGLAGGLLAAAVAFAPSFVMVLVGARRFDVLRRSARVQAFLTGAGPAVIGAIAGSAWPLAESLTEDWQVAVLVGAAAWLTRRGVVSAILLAGAVGAVVVLAGGPVPL